MVKSVGDEFLSFRAPGLAVVVRKGASLKQDDVSTLEKNQFNVMQFASRTVWLKENAERQDYLLTDGMEFTETSGQSPSRYLNQDAFGSFLVLRSLTTRICELFHIIATETGPLVVSKQKATSNGKSGWLNASEILESDTPMDANSFEFEEIKNFKMDGVTDKGLDSFIRVSGSANGIASLNSAAVYSLNSARPSGYLQIGEGSKINKPGLLMKFNPQLAVPDVNLIGDVIGKYFLKALGPDIYSQVENLSSIKNGLGSLRLTRVGDELSHLYKCIDIAIDCNAGLVPIMDGSRYEGSLISGGPGATLIHNGTTYPFQSPTSLKNDFLNFSEHAINLTAIARLLVSEKLSKMVIASTSMYDLREACINAVLSQTDRDEIIRRAAHLDYGKDSLVISPANIKRCMFLISNISDLMDSDPIGRLSLFSTDPVTIALSCFGEKSCPSWDIPNGTVCSLKKSVPPSVPVIQNRRGNRGEISDAAWVMVVRQTDLISACEEFREMASTLSYRSTSSILAKKVGHRVFSRERMGEFWGELRNALKVVNPNAQYEEMNSDKRKASDSPVTVVGEESNKRRRMDV